MAIVMDVSREALSEDCRGSFDTAGNATHVTRLHACCVAARALASGADAVCVFAMDASENGRSESRRGANRALFMATSAREVRCALSALERAVGLAPATNDGGSSRRRPAERPPGMPKGTPLSTALSLATMGLRRLAAASPPRVGDEAASEPPRRSILAILASDGSGRSGDPSGDPNATSTDRTRTIEAIEAAMAKLRGFDADATCRVLCVAPLVGDDAFLAEAAAAMTRCPACAAAAKRKAERRDRNREAGDANLPSARRHDAIEEREEDARETRCCSCRGASLTRAKNVVWSAAGFGKAHVARAALRDEIFGDNARDDDGFESDEGAETADATEPFSSPSLSPSTPLDDRLMCGTEHVHALELLSGAARADIEARLELTRRESATMAVETSRVVAAEPNAENPRFMNLRIERKTACFDANDVLPTVAALTSPIASVRVGRLLETYEKDAATGKETLRLHPETDASRRRFRAVDGKNASAFDERLELWLRVDGSLVVTHARDTHTTDTVARVGAETAEALRKLAAAQRELKRRAGETAATESECFARHPATTHPLPNDASGRAFRLIVGTGAGSRASYFWLRDVRAEDGARALAKFARKMTDPPTLSDAAGVPAGRLAALALAAPALAEAAARHGDDARIASLARDVARLEAGRARREDAEALRLRVQGSRTAKKKALRARAVGTPREENDASSRDTSRAEARKRAARIAARVFEASEPAPNLLPAELELGTERTAARARAAALSVAPSVAARRAFARPKTASGPLPPGARVTAANVASLFATATVVDAEEERESDDETRERGSD